VVADRFSPMPFAGLHKKALEVLEDFQQPLIALLAF
jgi:hypothetical protein